MAQYHASVDQTQRSRMHKMKRERRRNISKINKILEMQGTVCSYCSVLIGDYICDLACRVLDALCRYAKQAGSNQMNVTISVKTDGTHNAVLKQQTPMSE
eukprot:526212_1